MNSRVLLQTMIALASASLGSVVTSSWNKAIKTSLVLLGPSDSLAGLYTYVIVATVLAVVVLTALGRAAARVDGEDTFTPKAES